MKRKIFLSFLGSGKYEKCKYEFDAEETPEVRFIQNAIVNFYEDEFDEKYIICTPTAKNETYNLMVEEANQIIKNIKKYTLIEINEDNDEEGIWKIFDQIFSIIKPNDEIIFDITHSFRYIPMLGITLLQMTKFLKNVKVKKILYGLYTGNKEGKKNTVVDLTSFSLLQDWILDGNTLIKTGRGGGISEIAETELEKILKESNGKNKEAINLRKVATEMNKMSVRFRTNRGNDIIKGHEMKEIKRLINELEKVKENKLLIPFKHIINEIKNDIVEFQHNNVDNLFYAVQWCINKDLTQQGFTILEEGITTKLLDIVNENISKKEKVFNNQEERKNIFGILRKYKDSKENKKDVVEENKKIEIMRKLSNTHQSIKEIRNDINHAGFNEQSMSYDKFSAKLKEYFEEVKSIFFIVENEKIVKVNEENKKIIQEIILEELSKLKEVNNNKKALLIFSHELTENQEIDLKNTYKVIEINKLNNELQQIWSNVKIDENYKENLEKFKKFIEENYKKGDILIIQGNWGYTYNLVNWSIENGYIPVYSYTERNVEEIKEGEEVKKISYFKHIKFIEYK